MGVGLLVILLYLVVPAKAPRSLPTCTEAEIEAALSALPPYQPTETDEFVAVQNSHFVLAGETYLARGINYYPARYPWRRFLTEADLTTIDHELSILQAAKLNTLRIFLWNEALFTCPGSGAVPLADGFARLDGMIQQAAAHGFRLIITLNDLPDLVDYPLYDNPPYVVAQTNFIIDRYHDEAAILAWDLRNEGDIDYGTHNSIPARFTREQVLAWLEQTADSVRELDTNHLITAGWLYDNESTAPYVDFVSFHHWVGAPEAHDRILSMQDATDKPILLQEFGYSTQRMDAEAQARTIRGIIDVVLDTDIAGWLIWTAFDFPTDATCIPPNCPSVDNAEHHFGLWYSDYTPKPAVEILVP